MRYFFMRAQAARNVKGNEAVVRANMLEAVSIAEKIAPYRHHLEPALSRRAQLKSKFKKTSIGRASIIASLILLLLDAPPDYFFLSIPHFLHFLSRVSPMTEQHALSKDAIALRDQTPTCRPRLSSVDATQQK